jgi:hypothetical protein
VLLIDPSLVTDIVGACIALVVIVTQWPQHRAAMAAKAQTLKQAT